MKSDMSWGRSRPQDDCCSLPFVDSYPNGKEVISEQQKIRYRQPNEFVRFQGGEKRSRKFSLVLLVAALLLVVTSQPLVAAQDQVTIRWLSWWDSTYGADYLDDVQNRFTEATGIVVERTDTPWGSMFDTMVTNAQAGTATYDVLGMEGCCFLAGLDKIGAILPLDEYAERDADFMAGISTMAPLEWAGQLKMLNWYVFPYSYTYNIDMYEEAGLEPPTNWDEMVERTRQLEEAGVVEYGFGEGFSGEGHHVIYYMFGGRLAQLGGRFYDDEGNVVFNSPEGVQALQDWKDFYDSGRAIAY